MTYAGSTNSVSTTIVNLGVAGYYWTSSPKAHEGYNVAFMPNLIHNNDYSGRASSKSVRCFKNDNSIPVFYTVTFDGNVSTS